jgi:hypothetical protein
VPVFGVWSGFSLGRQVITIGGRIDLLGNNAEGNLTIVEFKRDRTPRDIVAQALGYRGTIVYRRRSTRVPKLPRTEPLRRLLGAVRYEPARAAEPKP